MSPKPSTSEIATDQIGVTRLALEMNFDGYARVLDENLVIHVLSALYSPLHLRVRHRLLPSNISRLRVTTIWHSKDSERNRSEL